MQHICVFILIIHLQKYNSDLLCLETLIILFNLYLTTLFQG